MESKGGIGRCLGMVMWTVLTEANSIGKVRGYWQRLRGGLWGQY